MFLRRTESGIYYIHDYYPKRRFAHVTDEQESLRQDIWAYKELEDTPMNRFTNELMAAITIISQSISSPKIGLVAVPPSKVNRESPIRCSIWNIHNWYDENITEMVFNCDKIIYDYGNLLRRISDIKTSHRGVRATYEEQKESIVCSRDRLWRYRTVFIILDDITTNGTSMDVCRDILIENGANEDKIYRLAIAKTV